MGYDGLSADQQQVLMQAGEELADTFANIVISANGNAMSMMGAGKTTRKIEVLEIATADRERLNEATRPFLDDWKENASSVGLNADHLLWRQWP